MLACDFRDRQDTRKRGKARRDGDHQADAGQPRALEQRLAIDVEIGKIEMTVAVYKHRRTRS